MDIITQTTEKIMIFVIKYHNVFHNNKLYTLTVIYIVFIKILDTFMCINIMLFEAFSSNKIKKYYTFFS